ncbi:MAG: G5 domain-containing protein [Patescibacteria group bacterium]
MRDIPNIISPFYLFLLCLSIGFGILSAVLMPKAHAVGDGERLVMIHDRGTEQGLISKGDTLREVFDEAGIRLDKNDRVEPGLDEPLVTSSYQVNVYRARPVIIVDGPVKQLVMSAYQTPKQIAKHAGIELQDEDEANVDMTNDFITDGASLRMSIDRASPVQLTLYGKAETVYTQATTVGDFLKEKDITLGKDDDMSLEESSEVTAGMQLSIWRNGKQTITQEEDVTFETEKIQDANRDGSFKQVNTPGVNGKKMVTYEIIMQNGVEVSRVAIQSVVTKQPVKQVETVGTKFNYTGGPLSEAQITALGTCESGMTATRNSGNGFYGAFQFMPSTWRTVAPAPYNAAMPHEAPLDAQKQAVQSLLSRSSIYTQFPGCAKKMQAQGIL